MCPRRRLRRHVVRRGPDPPAPKLPHVDGRRQFSDVPDGLSSGERLVTDEAVADFRRELDGELVLAPLTKGGNLPFRRLCVDFGCNVTVSEMVFARFVLKKNPVELARLRRHESERLFGVQIATNQISEGVAAGRLAADAGADSLDLNCGCPIHETWKRGLGAALLKKPKKLERLVRGIADGVPLPLTVKIRLGAGSSEAPASALAEAVENAGAAAVVIHGRTKEQRYTRAANWDLIGEIQRERSIPVIGNGDILTWYEHRERSRRAGGVRDHGGSRRAHQAVDFPGGGGGDGVGPHRGGTRGGLPPTVRALQGPLPRGRARKEAVHGVHALALWLFLPVSPAPGERVRRDGSLPSAAADETRGVVAAAEGTENAAELSRLERVLRCESEEAHVMLSEALWDAHGDETRAAELCEGRRRRRGIWNDGRRKRRSDGRGRGTAIGRWAGETPSEDESGVAREG